MLETILENSVLAISVLSAAAAFGAGLLIRTRDARAGRDSNFTEFIQNINEGYYRSSLDGKQLFANRALVHLNGYESEEEMLASVHDIDREWYVEPTRRDQFKALLEEHGFVENFVSEIYRHKSRERIWISENARLVTDSSGRPQYYEGIVREFTDTMKRLQLEELHTKLAEQVPGVLFQARWCSIGKFTLPYFSNGFTKILGNMPETVRDDASFLFKRLNSEDFASFVASAEKSARKLEPWNHEFRVRREDDREVWISIKATPELEPDGSCLWHGILTDSTENKQAENSIHNLAYYDPLTELPNRRLMLKRISKALDQNRARDRGGAVLYLDLDNFKTLNDTRGHGIGDQLLVDVANRLSECLSSNGELVGRFGGDEFVVLAENLGRGADRISENAVSLGKRILDAIDKPCQLEGVNFHPSCSIGIALFNDQMDSPDEVLRHADSAMYVAKENGKNRLHVYDSAMQEKLDTSVKLMAELRSAIGTDQLSLHYQMQVDADNRIIGAEGLLRWQHPQLGVIPPDRFIPPAEECGLIVNVTDWLLTEAFDTLQGWKTDPVLSTIRLSVNISAAQFHQDGFAENIASLLAEYDVSPDRLMLEMTEHVLTGDLLRVKHVMTRLKAMGIGFSLDDFGTGYSSLAHLRELPFDEVKIDGKFVTDLESSKSDREIVHAILAMARALELETVAEWVETEGQREFLAKEGCDALQGFLFGSAMPRKAFETAARLPLFSKRSSEVARQPAGSMAAC